MNEPATEIEGTWEEVAARAPEFTGRRVRLTLLDSPVDAADEVIIPRRPKATPEQAALGILPAIHGTYPVTDFDAWMASMPHFDGTEEEFAAFEQAIAENRAMRRELVRDHPE
jgi:hypothetical protein